MQEFLWDVLEKHKKLQMQSYSLLLKKLLILLEKKSILTVFLIWINAMNPNSHSFPKTGQSENPINLTGRFYYSIIRLKSDVNIKNFGVHHE